MNRVAAAALLAFVLAGCGSAPKEAPRVALHTPQAVDEVTLATPPQGAERFAYTEIRLALSAPTRIRLERLGVEAPVVPVGLDADGAMEAPADPEEVGWFSLGRIPGELGRAVLTGHLDSHAGPAVFYRLGELRPGDRISVWLGSEKSARSFTVHEVASYKAESVPLERIFGPAALPELVLITCEGSFDRVQGQYDRRLVVFAR